ncbi:MAG: neutral/alkaline non-lysosomal ceramidase N-terminal domain-containing protein [Candidatus Hydrogenedentes bacterium]|nr:neutral/alkaline non-lysosomal ceramidase N-terminal domain-containing protein [Candidatus Hydrogenedentota bacterium]
MSRIILFAVTCLIALPCAHAFEAGAAKVEITPPLETPLNGYYDRLGRGSMAVHDPLWVRCVYISDGETSAFLLNADLCIINEELRDRVLELAPQGVSRDSVFLTATHTHSAQGAMCKGLLFRSVSGRFMPEVLEATAQRFAECMNQAYAGRKRATIGHGTTTLEDFTENRQVPDGPVDPQLGVIRVEDSDGNAIAIVSNVAAHPTTVGGVDMMSISADYPGFYYAELEAQASPGCVAMFMNGAEGNQRPANPSGLRGWAFTEHVGKTLAQKTLEVASKIKCVEAKLHVATVDSELPLSIASSLLPEKAMLKTLEIEGLLLTFFPGEPCVEIGLELRRQAKARGYADQFTVGLANGYLLYFAPRELYGNASYECAMSQYGPGIGEWFHTEFGKLMTRGEPSPSTPEVSPPAVETLGPASRIRLAGSGYEMGRQRGAAYREALQQAFRDNVVVPCDAKEWIPNTGLWPWAPPFVNQTPLALPRLAIGARPMLATLAPELMDEVAGIADGAGLPFDAVWLTQCAPILAARSNKADLYRSPFCTMFALTGDRAGADDCLVGRNFDWSKPEQPVIVEARPKGLRRFVTIGFPWTVGAFSGMNDAGVVLCVERVESQGEPSLDSPPIDLILRDVLQNAADVPAALERLMATPPSRGYHVLVAGPVGGEARVVEFGAAPAAREPADGLLLGVLPDSGAGNADAIARYTRVASLTAAERILSAEELATALRDREPGTEGQARILNDWTRHSVVFEPKARRLHVSFPGSAGDLGEAVTISLASGAER